MKDTEWMTPLIALAWNTDRQLWRKDASDFSPSIHVTAQNGIGINVGGHVIVAPVERWHETGKQAFCVDDEPLKK